MNKVFPAPGFPVIIVIISLAPEKYPDFHYELDQKQSKLDENDNHENFKQGGYGKYQIKLVESRMNFVKSVVDALNNCVFRIGVRKQGKYFN